MLIVRLLEGQGGVDIWSLCRAGSYGKLETLVPVLSDDWYGGKGVDARYWRQGSVGEPVHMYRLMCGGEQGESRRCRSRR